MNTTTDNPNCKRTYASFRLIGDRLDSDDITARLSLSPTSAHQKGDLFKSRSGMLSHRTGIWLLSTEKTLATTRLENHLTWLLEAIEPVGEQVRAIRGEYSLDADFHCYWLSGTGHGGPVLSPRVLKRIALLELDLSFDYYGPYED